MTRELEISPEQLGRNIGKGLSRLIRAFWIMIGVIATGVAVSCVIVANQQGLSREQIADMIGWEHVFWVVGMINVGAMLPQIVRLIITEKSKDIAPTMIWVYLGTQIGFGLQGYFTRQPAQAWTMGISAAMSVLTLALIYKYRKPRA